MPSKPGNSGGLSGLALLDASAPRDPSMDSPFRGESFGTSKTKGPTALTETLGLPDETETPVEEENEFAGMGPLLEEDDKTVFKTVDGLVQRQELIALNHLAQDIHWTYVKLGYPWSTLTKEPNRDVYKHSLPYGSAGISIQAIPNKAWDQINKTTEALLVDFPQAEAEPGDDSEKAQAAADIATRFLAIDAGERGTNDAVLFNDRVARALTCATSYLECWTDPTGGGYIPLQIPANPQAENPRQPLLGPDGMPTAHPVMRYVTEVGPDGQPTETSQFTDDPTQAAPQWQAKLRESKWQREHVRIFPESATIENAQKVIILGFCTLGEGKSRWQSMAAMSDDELTRLCDWTPVRYIALLPPFQRSRWSLSDGKEKNKQGSSDERIFFYYHIFAKASPDHRKGADVVVSGIDGGLVIDRKLLAKDVEVPAKPDPKNPAAPTMRKETRCMEIPVVAITPRQDPDEQDPTGRAYIEMIAGAVENNAHLAMSFSEALDKNLHLEGYINATSPVDGQQRADARATGDMIPIQRPEDKPVWGEKIPLDNAFFNFYELSDEAVNSIGSTERAAKGQDSSAERSGKAIALATANNNVSLGGMNQAVNNAYARWCRIKVERMMCDFTTMQQIAYVGEDGIFKQEDLNAMDFALVGKITIKAGTGGLWTPEQKFQNLTALANAQVISVEESRDAARPAFSRKLGLPPSPAEQRIERQVNAFNDGPPEGWVEQQQAFTVQKQQFDAQLAVQQQAEQQAMMAPAQPVPGAPPMIPPVAPTVAPATPALQPPVAPWTPFDILPTDDEPANATYRRRRLSRLIDSAKFSAFPDEWKQLALDEYARMRTVESQAQAAAPPQPAEGAV